MARKAQEGLASDPLRPPATGFTVAGQFGDPAADDAIWPHAKLLKRAFAADGALPFSAALIEIAFLIRGDGEFQQFGFEGHENIVVEKRDRAVSVDIGVPMTRWQGASAAALADYLVGAFAGSLPEVLNACRKKGLHTDAGLVATRLESALRVYRASVDRELSAA